MAAATWIIAARAMPRWEFECIDTPNPSVSHILPRWGEARRPPHNPWSRMAALLLTYRLAHQLIRIGQPRAARYYSARQGLAAAVQEKPRPPNPSPVVGSKYSAKPSVSMPLTVFERRAAAISVISLRANPSISNQLMIAQGRAAPVALGSKAFDEWLGRRGGAPKAIARRRARSAAEIKDCRNSSWRTFPLR